MTPVVKPRTPAGLATRGRKFWRTTVADYELSAAEIELLTEACRTLDTLDVLDAACRTLGATVLGSAGQPVGNPALAEARGQRLVLHRLVAALSLPDPELDSLPTTTSIRATTAAAARWAGHEKDS